MAKCPTLFRYQFILIEAEVNSTDTHYKFEVIKLNILEIIFFKLKTIKCIYWLYIDLSMLK